MLSALWFGVGCVAAQAPQADASAAQDSPAPVVLSGAVEAQGQWSFNQPDNGITAYRGFDNRHGSLTLHNVWLTASFDAEGVVGALGLQVGAAPAAYYLAEPALAGAAGVGPTGASLFQFLQQAHAGFRVPVLEGLVVSAGLFLSPIGPESITIKDDWNWSRSTLFFALPFYHAGVRATLQLNERWSVAALVTNGWNNIVDNNDGKSVALSVGYAVPEVWSAQVLTFGGPERGRGALEGDGSWRQLLDAFATWTPLAWLALQAHGDAGVEFNDVGRSAWLAGALAARVQPVAPLHLAARVDALHEDAAGSGAGSAARIFFPAATVGSATFTLDLRPVEHVSVRLELRHDRASEPIYFAGHVAGNGTSTPWVPNAPTQTTLTLGLTGWF